MPGSPGSEQTPQSTCIQPVEAPSNGECSTPRPTATLEVTQPPRPTIPPTTEEPPPDAAGGCYITPFIPGQLPVYERPDISLTPRNLNENVRFRASITLRDQDDLFWWYISVGENSGWVNSSAAEREQSDSCDEHERRAEAMEGCLEGATWAFIRDLPSYTQAMLLAQDDVCAALDFYRRERNQNDADYNRMSVLADDCPSRAPLYAQVSAFISGRDELLLNNTTPCSVEEAVELLLQRCSLGTANRDAILTWVGEDGLNIPVGELTGEQGCQIINMVNIMGTPTSQNDPRYPVYNSLRNTCGLSAPVALQLINRAQLNGDNDWEDLREDMEDACSGQTPPISELVTIINNRLTTPLPVPTNVPGCEYYVQQLITKLNSDMELVNQILDEIGRTSDPCTALQFYLLRTLAPSGEQEIEAFRAYYVDSTAEPPDSTETPFPPIEPDNPLTGYYGVYSRLVGDDPEEVAAYEVAILNDGITDVAFTNNISELNSNATTPTRGARWPIMTIDRRYLAYLTQEENGRVRVRVIELGSNQTVQGIYLEFMPPEGWEIDPNSRLAFAHFPAIPEVREAHNLLVVTLRQNGDYRIYIVYEDGRGGGEVDPDNQGYVEGRNPSIAPDGVMSAAGDGGVIFYENINQSAIYFIPIWEVIKEDKVIAGELIRNPPLPPGAGPATCTWPTVALDLFARCDVPGEGVGIYFRQFAPDEGEAEEQEINWQKLIFEGNDQPTPDNVLRLNASVAGGQIVLEDDTHIYLGVFNDDETTIELNAYSLGINLSGYQWCINPDEPLDLILRNLEEQSGDASG